MKRRPLETKIKGRDFCGKGNSGNRTMQINIHTMTMRARKERRVCVHWNVLIFSCITLRKKWGQGGRGMMARLPEARWKGGGGPFLLFTISSTYQTTNDFLTCLCFIRFFKSINIKIEGKETVLYLLTQKSVCNAKSGNSRLQSSVSCDRICVKYRGFLFVCF